MKYVDQDEFQRAVSDRSKQTPNEVRQVLDASAMIVDEYARQGLLARWQTLVFTHTQPQPGPNPQSYGRLALNTEVPAYFRPPAWSTAYKRLAARLVAGIWNKIVLVLLSGSLALVGWFWLENSALEKRLVLMTQARDQVLSRAASDRLEADAHRKQAQFSENAATACHTLGSLDNRGLGEAILNGGLVQ